MDVMRLDERDLDWSRVSERLEAGETVQVMRGEQVFATVAPGESVRPDDRLAREAWKAKGVDWDEIERFASTLRYDPTNSVVEMRKQARY